MDIGALLNSGTTSIRDLSREYIYRILTSKANPNPASYPRTRLYPSGPYWQFQPAWVRQHPWLYYSRHCDGAFCRACVFFAPEQVGGQPLGQFVTTLFRSWANRSQKVLIHCSSEYHLNSMTKMDEFLTRFRQPLEVVSTKLDVEAQKIVEDNLHVVESLLKVAVVSRDLHCMGIVTIGLICLTQMN